MASLWVDMVDILHGNCAYEVLDLKRWGKEELLIVACLLAHLLYSFVAFVREKQV